MLTTSEAQNAIGAAMPQFGSETVSLDAAVGRILQQIVTAERDQPPFDRVMMDGIALKFDELEGGRRSFNVQGTQHAGDAVLQLTDDTGCIEIMTGAVMPLGTDCVVPVERLTVSAGSVRIEADYRAERLQYVHPQGSDHTLGTDVLNPGKAITPAELAIVASCGLESVVVGRSPSISVISTGNELVAPGMPIEPHQIRLSNGPALVAMLRQQGLNDCRHDHLVDDPELLRENLGHHLSASDVLILSGGVSMGKADFVPKALADLGVEVVFHKISQRPGKPMWFGIGQGGQVVFALPGNPVSSLVCCRQYVLPALLEACGRVSQSQEYAELVEELVFKPQLTCFLPVRLVSGTDGKTIATPVPTNTSGDFTSLGRTDGYVELARETSLFSAGCSVPLHRWDRP